MSKTRIKKVKLSEIKSRDEAEAVMNELAIAANNQRKINAQRDAEILKINEKYEASLAQCALELDAKTDQLRAWAETNPEQFPKGIKSIKMTSGTLGFRTGTPKLALLSRSWTWEKVLEKAQSLIPNFIRSKPELDKEAIINQRDEEPIKWAITNCGMKVVQDESFFIEPALADTEARQTVEVK